MTSSSTPSSSRTGLFYGALIFWTLSILAGTVWRFSSLYQRFSPEMLTHSIRLLEGHAWTSLAIMGIFAVGGLLMFAHAVLLWTTVLVFTPWHAVLYCELGTLSSGVTVYGLGRIARPGVIDRIAGSSLERVSTRLGHKGKSTLILLHWFPLCPFSVLNFIAGATHITFSDFLIGTLIGCTPGILLISFFGHEMVRILKGKHWLEIIPVALVATIVFIANRKFRSKLNHVAPAPNV